jgi:holo-[acyl-carrier protein] synthase
MRIGIDAVSTGRVRRLLEASERARDRIFTRSEISYCESRGRKRFEHYAARFAAKEAALKAMGCGWRGDLRFCEIEVYVGPLGAPELRFSDRIAHRLTGLRIRHAGVSLTHDAERAVAVVCLEHGMWADD